MSPTLHTIHPSLYRTALLAGADPGFVVLEVTTVLALLFVMGIHLATVLLALFYGFVVHGLVVWMSAKDPQIAALYLRSLRAADFYPAAPGLTSPARPVRTSVPVR